MISRANQKGDIKVHRGNYLGHVSELCASIVCTRIVLLLSDYCTTITIKITTTTTCYLLGVLGTVAWCNKTLSPS